jgi:hypothetical protein
MRTLPAVAASLGALLLLNVPVGAAPKAKRTLKPPAATAQLPQVREEVECERARHADRTGAYAGYRCWARDAFSHGNWSMR